MATGIEIAIFKASHNKFGQFIPWSNRRVRKFIEAYMAENEISPEGEMLQASLAQMREHALSHQCPDCVERYDTLVRAMTAWLSSWKTKQPQNPSGNAQLPEPINLFGGKRP